MKRNIKAGVITLLILAAYLGILKLVSLYPAHTHAVIGFLFFCFYWLLFIYRS